MSFSRLLLVAVSSKKYISGEGNDKVVVKPRVVLSGSNHDLYAGKVVLCFQLDDRKDETKRVSKSLGISENSKRCDGLIFYAQDQNKYKVICLVEMKSTSIKDAVEQIKSTRNHINELLRGECNPHCSKELSHIKWKACLYHHGASPEQVTAALKELKQIGFDSVGHFTNANNDVGPLLRGEKNAEEMAKKYKHKKR